jgi:hypothetical protein
MIKPNYPIQMKNMLLTTFFTLFGSLYAQNYDFIPIFVSGYIDLICGNVIEAKILYHPEMSEFNFIQYRLDQELDSIAVSDIAKLRISNSTYLKIDLPERSSLLEIIEPGELMICRTCCIYSSKRTNDVNVYQSNSEYFFVKGSAYEKLTPEAYLETLSAFTKDKPDFQIDMHNTEFSLRNAKTAVRDYNSK